MFRRPCWLLAAAFAGTLTTPPLHVSVAAEAKMLVAFRAEFDTKSAVAQDARPTIVTTDAAAVLQVVTGHKSQWPGVTLPAPHGNWDLSSYSQIAVEVKNSGTQPVAVHLRVDSPGGDGAKNSITGQVALKPGETRTLTVPLRRKLPAALAEKLFGMRGYPGGYAKEDGLDVSHITQLIVFVDHPQEDHSFQLSDIQATGSHEQASWVTVTSDKFFPMIDGFGQFIHKDWPGKTHSGQELQDALDRERAELAAQPSPADWDQYGGWAAGPQLKATGFFYPLKHEGKWWLVDPEGRLFWSHGVDCVGFGEGSTPITDREFYFAELPTDNSPLAKFYGQGSWAPHNYYENKGTYRTLNFRGANLQRKYGTGWQQKAAEVSHQRLRSWAMNTIANWSDSQICLMRKTPYVVSAGSSGAKSIEGSSGYWGKFPDPFDPSFRAAIERRMSFERDRSVGDPFCIGYFVDNELGWGDKLSLAKAALASPPEQAAKLVFLKDLETKYQTIEKLNAAWNTTHTAWQTLRASRTPPDEKLAREDLESFYTRIAEEYFRISRDLVKQFAPHNLYLGCRFAWVNDLGARAAAKYCDVIGYNLYQDTVDSFRLPAGVDKPVMVGEFHFGALDRGMFHTGLRPTASQQARADAYRNYVTGAVRNPLLVGTHWFQYSDQATTGRGDGENYQIGLVDICDNPYPETIQTVREVGQQMYKLRLETP
ncbi:MAG: beta-galactosidase [Planctomycetota bacterium]|nr:beta-galactosidase [Planctomycetota bacterium]